MASAAVMEYAFMPLKWAEIKAIIRTTLGPRLIPVGFPNPGVTMWRYRDPFVDVVHVYHRSSTSGFSVEFGCHPRYLKPVTPNPFECLFRTWVQQTTDTPIPPIVFQFADTAAEQQRRIDLLAPLVVGGAERWFTQFTSIVTAIALLERNAERGIAHVADAGIGSPAYVYALQCLQSVLHTSG